MQQQSSLRIKREKPTRKHRRTTLTGSTRYSSSLLETTAVVCLAQPLAASAAERNWSIYGQIRTANRSRLKHSTADKLVYAKEALHLEQKMQDAGWEPDLERHESDTDSEGSDEEQDFAEGVSLTEEQVLALCM